MRKPQFGEANLGALSGAAIGSTGGLFGVGIASAILARDIAVVFSMPVLGVICFLIGGPLGWILGGQIGPRLGDKFNSAGVEIAGGVLGGLIPVVMIALWGWYKATH